jgi:hypothetical protein
MTTRSSLGTAALLCGLLLSATPAWAQSQAPFVPVGQARWIIAGADATVQGQDGRTLQDSAFNYRPLPGLDRDFFGLFEVTEPLALDVKSPDGTAAVHAEGTVFHSSFIGSDVMRFEGRADVSATASGTPGPLTSARIGTFSRPQVDFMGVIFDVPSPIEVAISMHADVMPARGSFEFVLATANEGVDLLRLSTASEAGLPEGELLLSLAPGRYAVSGGLETFALLNEHVLGSAGWQLRVVPIPEPASWALMLAGLALVGVSARKAARSKASVG